ncbi:MAG: hypothetical protein IID36_00600, partial [Planctomycetes bacterium]|nr:hypothetical protein [Planctomycetota bacterium]
MNVSPRSRRKTPRARRPAVLTAFTLVELVIVIAVIIVLTAVILPSVTELWAERKLADAENTLAGSLMTARRNALLADRGESGLLFVVDPDGVQTIYPIEHQNQKNPNTQTEYVLASRHRFVILDKQALTLPSPIRVVPRYAVLPGTGDDEDNWLRFSAEELADNKFPEPAMNGPGPAGDEYQEGQRHRNFFTIVFSNDGQLLVRRDVLIVDADADADGFGDRTGLLVSNPIQYGPQRSEGAGTDIDPENTEFPVIGDLIVDGASDLRAVNFPSVDGLLVYADSVFNRLGSGDDVVD